MDHDDADLSELLDDGKGAPLLGRAVTSAGALGAAVLAKRALSAVWEQVTGNEPPRNPASPATSWRDAVLWGAAAGVVAGVSRVAGRRVATRAAARLTSERERTIA